MSELTLQQRMRYKAQNDEMIDQHFTEAGKLLNEGAAELDAAQAREEAEDARYRYKSGGEVFVVLTWPTGAHETTTLRSLALCLPDYMADELADFDHGEDDEWSFKVVKMTQEQYDNLPEFLGP